MSKTKTACKHNGWGEILGRNDIQFAVLTKDNRIQIIKTPTKKQLRERGKRGWKVAGLVDNTEASSRDALLKIVVENDGISNDASNNG